MKTKGKSILSKLMVVLLAIGITAGCCPAFSVAEADDETVASAALSAFKTEASMLYNKRADGEKLQIDGAKENHSAVAFEGGGSASFDISTIGATGFTAIVGLDGSSQDSDKAKFSVLCDGSEIAASSELTKGNAEKLTADIPAGAKSIELKAEGSGLAVFGDAAVTFPFSHNGYADMTVMRIEQQINDAANPLKINEDIKIGSDTFDKGFAVYPQSADNLGQVSELYFDVSGMDAKTFTAKVGLNNADNTNGAVFRVYADGQKVYESDTVTGETKAVDVSADITGANLVTLTVYNNGENAGDNAVWAQPRLSLNADKSTHIKERVSVSLTDLKWKSAISESKSPQINMPYEDGADYKINVGGIEYNYGIAAHPYNKTTPSTITYDLSDYNFNYFTVKVGKTKEKHISVDDQRMTEIFRIYGDGKLLAESEPIAMGHYTALSADVTGVDTLSLVIAAGDGGYGWGACAWCEPTLYTEVGPGQIAISYPFGDDQSRVIGNAEINVKGVANGVKVIKATHDSKSLGLISVKEDGSFAMKIKGKDLYPGKNVIEFQAVGGKNSPIKLVITKESKYSVMDAEWKSHTGVFLSKGAGVQSICSTLTIGSQVHQTNDGFCIKPDDGSDGCADVVVDLTSLGNKVEYFTSLVGLDDFAYFDQVSSGGSVIYQVLSGDRVLAQTGILTANEFSFISCDIPASATELTLRVTNAGDGNVVDYADWLYPSLYLKKSDYASIEKNLYSDNNVGGNYTINAKSSVGVRFATTKPFSAVSIVPEKAADTVTGSLYKFIYSYDRSIQGEALSTVTATKGSGGKYTFALNKEYDDGEYLFVADGVTEIKANGSQYGYNYADGIAQKGLINMALTFGGSYDSYLTAVTPEPDTTNAGTNHATAAEKARAKKTYEEYITNLANFPSKMTIGEDSYVGFSSSDFTLKSTDKQQNTVTRSENTTFTLAHKSGLEFELRCVYYPDYAAFDWVIYFTNTGKENSPKVYDISPAELTFEGENPVILSNYSDGGPFAPFVPQTIYLNDGDSRTFAPQNGRSTEAAFPYYNFEYGNKGAFVVTSWSGIWQADFNYNNGVTTYSGRQQTFNSYLKSGETARTPLTAVILYDGRDTDRATNLWRNWFMDCNMEKDDNGNLPTPFVAGVTSAVYNEMSKATDQNQIDAIRTYLEHGIDINVWWMDADWYAKVDPNQTGFPVGNWVPDTDRFPSKFKAISDYANSEDVKTLLWFEPERISITTKQYNNTPETEYRVKPEWLIGYGEAGSQIAYGVEGNAFQLDLGNKEAFDWLCNRVSTIIKEGGISIYREDLNSNYIDETWAAANAAHPDRTGMTENGCVMGHYAYWDVLLALDEVELLDSCASGGHRLDLETMRRAVALHPTDFNYNDLTSKQIGSYGLASWFPFTGANTGVANYTTQTNKYVLRSAYRQALILQYNVNTMSDRYYDVAKNCVDEWKGVSKYFYDDLYQLTKNTMGSNQWYSYEYLSEEEQSGFAMVFRRSGGSADTQNIRLKGLNPADTYEITFADQSGKVTATGAELMSSGVSLTLTENENGGGSDSDIIYIKRTAAVAGDRDALGAAIDSAKALIDAGLVEAGYDGQSSFNLVLTYEKALAVYENDGESAQAVNAAAEQLKNAQAALKKGSAGSKAEVENIIGSIGGINEQNAPYREELIKLVEKIVEKSGVKPDNADLLKQAREALDGFNTNIVYGDVDANGTVEATDALWALQAYVGSRQLDEKAFKAADVNLDEKVDTSDALAILQYAVKLRDKLPIA